MAKQLHDLLNTKNKGEQVKRVENLLQLAGAPVIDLVVRYDTRTQEIGISVIGVDDLPTEAMHQILGGAQEGLRRQEKAALQQRLEQANTPQDPPAGPDGVPLPEELQEVDLSTPKDPEAE
jgi:hypothetical protein